MRFNLISDLHGAAVSQTADADFLIMAGDMDEGLAGLEAAATLATADCPVIYVPGNHEFYGWDYNNWCTEAQAFAAKHPHLHLLNPGALRITPANQQAVTIVGATLWTNFELFPHIPAVGAGSRCQACLADFKHIRYQDRKLTWRDQKAWFEREFAYLRNQVAQANARGDFVLVITHHAPSAKSSAPQYLDDVTNAGFASSLEPYAADFVDVWCHGHMHNNSDYELGRCRIVANPHGYIRLAGIRENDHYNPLKIIQTP